MRLIAFVLCILAVAGLPTQAQQSESYLHTGLTRICDSPELVEEYLHFVETLAPYLDALKVINRKHGDDVCGEVMITYAWEETVKSEPSPDGRLEIWKIKILFMSTMNEDGALEMHVFEDGFFKYGPFLVQVEKPPGTEL